MTTAEHLVGKVKLQFPITVGIKGRYLYGLEGDDEKWQKMRNLQAEPSSFKIVSNPYANDFKYLVNDPNHPLYKKRVWYYKDYIGGRNGHTGIDIILETGTCIYAAYDGQIFEVNDPIRGTRTLWNGNETAYSPTLGGWLTFKSSYENTFFRIGHGHLKKLFVTPGEYVKQGQLIALGNNTGYFTTGAHLHWSFDFWNSEWTGQLFANNGMRGYQDASMLFPQPYLQVGHLSSVDYMYVHAREKAHERYTNYYFGLFGRYHVRQAQKRFGFDTKPRVLQSAYYDYINRFKV